MMLEELYREVLRANGWDPPGLWPAPPMTASARLEVIMAARRTVMAESAIKFAVADLPPAGNEASALGHSSRSGGGRRGL